MTSYAEREYLLPQARKAVAGWDQWGWPDYRSGIIEDDRGYQIGFWGPFNPSHRPDWRQFVFCAKRKLHDEHYCSFMPKLLGRALGLGGEDGALVCQFIGGGPYTIDDAWVFDARRAINRRRERVEQVDSKRQRDVDVFDVAARENGLTVREWLKDEKPLPAPQYHDGTQVTTLRQYGIAPEEVLEA